MRFEVKCKQSVLQIFCEIQNFCSLPYACLHMVKCTFVHQRVASAGEDVSKRIVHSGRYSFKSSCKSTKLAESGGSDGCRRHKSILESIDVNDLGTHHILQLPPLIEPKG